LLQVLLVVVEKEYKEQNMEQELQIETELHYKLDYYNKVLVKHNKLDNKTLNFSNLD
jgi:hypothetical protein